MQTEVFTRRRLPHWFVPGAVHFITYRLAGTLPAAARDQLQARKDALQRQRPRPGETPALRRERIHKQLFAEYDRLLDAGSDVRWLADPRVAALVRANLYHHHGTRYYLLAYCIMANHVHVLLQPLDRAADSPELPDDMIGELPDGGNPLTGIMHSLKSYTAHEANRILGRNGPFWQRESYDHWVRDEAELERIVAYIAANPVEAGLVARPEDWLFCSAHDRYRADGERTGWLAWETAV